MNARHDTPRIAIAGAGLGGLLCASVLQRSGADVTVYERDSAADARAQGGTLDLHTPTGQRALRIAGLIDAFDAHARPEGQEMREYAPDGTLTDLHEDGTPTDELPEAFGEYRPEIDRSDLRAILLDSLDPSTVRWGTPVRAVESDGSGARIALDDGDEHVDLVIGADGAWSPTRAAVSDADPLYTGSTLIEAWFADVDERHPELARIVGDGMAFAADPDDDSRVLVLQRCGGNRIRAYIGLKCPRDWAERAGIDLRDADAVRAHLLDLFDGWDESLRAFIRDNEGPFLNRPVYRLPFPHTWDPVPGVTLLGDAAHLMPPAGQGANLALIDAAELASGLASTIRDGRPLDEAVRDYERVMMPRGATAAAESAAMIE